jgi:hypothetical protein
MVRRCTISNNVQTIVQASQQAFCDLTRHGLLVGLAEQIHRTGLRARLQQVPLAMKTVRYDPTDKALTLIASVAVGCEDTLEINTTLRPDSVAAALLQMPGGARGGPPQFPDQSIVSQYLRQATPDYVLGLRALHHPLLSENRLAKKDARWHLYLIDMDTTFYGVYGTTYEKSDTGFSGRHRSTRGYRQGLATYADTKELIDMTFLPARYHDIDHIAPLLDGIYQHHPDLSEVLLRGDAHFGSVQRLVLYQANRLHYLMAGADPKTARLLAKHAEERRWQRLSRTRELYDVGWAELTSSHPKRRVRTRVILDREPKPDTLGYSYKHYVTDLSPAQATAEEVWHLYYGRENSESDIEERKNVLASGSLRSRTYYGICTFQWLNVLTSNLLVWMKAQRLQDTPLAAFGRHKLIRDAMQVPARLVQVEAQWIACWDQQHPLTPWLVAAFNRPLPEVRRTVDVQLPLPLVGVFGSDPGPPVGR